MRNVTRRQLAGILGFPALCRVAAASPFGRLTQSDLLGWMDAAGVPGAAVVLIEKGKPAFLCAGVLKRGSDQAITENTAFAAASLSKQLAAHAVLDLVAAGAWDLDKPLGDFVTVQASPEAGRVTARHALSHSSGFPNWRNAKDQALQPATELGKTFRYSGEGYVYLQRVIEKISGEPFARYMRNKVLEPLDMKHSSFTWRVPQGTPLAQPHDRQGNPSNTRFRDGLEKAAASFDKQPEDWTYEDQEAVSAKLEMDPLPNYFGINAAASMHCTAADYARFLIAAMKRPQFGERQVDISGSPKTGGRAMLGWGLGWGVQSTAAGVTWWQWGDNNGYKNFVLAEPAKQWAMAVFTNGDKGRAVYERAIRAVKGDQPAFLWL